MGVDGVVGESVEVSGRGFGEIVVGCEFFYVEFGDYEFYQVVRDGGVGYDVGVELEVGCFEIFGFGKS